MRLLRDSWTSRGRCLLPLVLALVVAGCVPSLPPKPAMLATQEEFRQRVQTICIDTVQLGVVGDDVAPLAAKVDEQIVAALRHGGYAVQPVGTARQAWQTLVLAEGGPVDPYSGRFDSAKFESLASRHRQGLVTAFGCDAFLHAHVAVVRAPLNGMVHWDGAWADIGAGGMVGWVLGMSLWVALDDRNGDEIYFHTGGIQPLVEVDAGFFSSETHVLSGNDLVATDDEVWQGAWLALEPILPVDRRPRAPDPSGRRVPPRVVSDEPAAGGMEDPGAAPR